MRILFTRFPLESAHGGAEVQTMSLMKGLRERGHAVAFLGSCPVLLAECRNEGFPVVELSIGAPPVSKFHAFTFLLRRNSMQRKLEAALAGFSRLDAIYMLSMTEKLLLTEAARARNIRTLWIEHDRVGRWLTKNPWLLRLRVLSENVTTVCVSALSRKLYLDLGWSPERTVAIPNGVSLERLHTSGDSLVTGFPLSPDSAHLHLGCIARLTEDKGVDLLIEAVAAMPDVTLTIVGTGREEGFLRQRVAEVTAREGIMEPRIQLQARVPDIARFYHAVDALVLPSRDHDPFGLVVAEAMLHGTPTIVTRACGIAGYLTHGRDALIVEANSVGALRQAIASMEDLATRTQIGNIGQETAETLFAEKTMISAYEKLLSVY